MGAWGAEDPAVSAWLVAIVFWPIRTSMRAGPRLVCGWSATPLGTTSNERRVRSEKIDNWDTRKHYVAGAVRRA